MAKRKVISLKKALLFWDKYNGDSVDEDEENDVLESYGNAKRRKWITSPYPARVTMANDGIRPTPCLSRDVTKIKFSKKKNIHDMFKPELRKIGTDILEVVDLEPMNHACEDRSPLSDLAVRSKSPTPETFYNGSVNRHTHRSRSHAHERRQNGIQPNLFNVYTSPTRMSKSFAPRQIALDETFQIHQKLEYSRLLQTYHKTSRNTSTMPSFQHSKQKCSPNGSLKPGSSPNVLETIDLTSDDKKRTHIRAKPWQGASAKEEDEVKIIEERPPIPRVNSLERQLSQYNLVQPSWIEELQSKYMEKERVALRQVQEERIKKELYAQHNQKRMEALDARIRKHLTLTDVILDDTEELITLPEITPEIKAKIDASLKPSPPSEVLIEGFGQRITRSDIQTLNKLNWLNDEVINFYMNLLIERGKEDKNTSIYAFNTFFYPKLRDQGYSSLKRWTKKVDIFAHDLLLVPIHLGMHWCMATIDFRTKKVQYYDSMGSENNRCLTALLKYLTEESMDKKKSSFDTSDWTTENVKDIPQQMNGSDCGMFSCMFAEYLSRNAKITFSQKDMPYFRRKMVYEIVSKKLLQ